MKHVSAISPDEFMLASVLAHLCELSSKKVIYFTWHTPPYGSHLFLALGMGGLFASIQGRINDSMQRTYASSELTSMKLMPAM